MPSEVPVAELTLAHVVAPELPLKIKLITPLGASALALPVARAVKVMVPPRVGVPVVVRRIVGVARATRVDGAVFVTAPTAL